MDDIFSQGFLFGLIGMSNHERNIIGMRRDFFGVKHVLVKRFCFRFFCLWDCETM